jgi:DNA-nicking Smr family endonuclease
MSNKHFTDDSQDWHNATKEIKKIDSNKKITPSLKPLPDINQPIKLIDKLGTKQSLRSTKLEELHVGNTSGVDTSTLKKIEKGNYKIDSCLDLHGLSQEKSYLALEKFIKKSYSEHKRLLLVIVGKGYKSINKKGLLRDLLPSWINYPTIRPLVINIQYANQKHGGTGAFYILLKRIKNDPNHKANRAS